MGFSARESEVKQSQVKEIQTKYLPQCSIPLYYQLIVLHEKCLYSKLM